MDMFMQYGVVLWGLLMIGTLAIGGFFMFRKFLKQIPKADGKSDMDWQEYYIEKTKHMWNEEELTLLDDFVAPVPELFRSVARETIAGKIGEVALMKQSDTITKEIMIEGYIIGTPKRDHKFLRKLLKEKNIEVAPYEQFFELANKDYRKNWNEKYKQSTHL